MRIIFSPRWLDVLLHDNRMSYQALLNDRDLRPYLSKKDWMELHMLQSDGLDFLLGRLTNVNDDVNVDHELDALQWKCGLPNNTLEFTDELMSILRQSRTESVERRFYGNGVLLEDQQIGFVVADGSRFLSDADPVVVLRCVSCEFDWPQHLRERLLQLSYESCHSIAQVASSVLMSAHVATLTTRTHNSI